MNTRKATLHDLAAGLEKKEFSSRELCQEYLKRIDARCRRKPKSTVRKAEKP